MFEGSLVWVGLGVAVEGEMGSAGGWMGIGASVQKRDRYLGKRLTCTSSLEVEGLRVLRVGCDRNVLSMRWKALEKTRWGVEPVTLPRGLMFAAADITHPTR